MPCGGIAPYAVADNLRKVIKCYYCRRTLGMNGQAYFCIEWDAIIHGECIHAFLDTEEGQIVLEHKHKIQIEEGGK